jgi:hypothetical protein
MDPLSAKTIDEFVACAAHPGKGVIMIDKDALSAGLAMIAAGVGVFIVSWTIQATMGDSTMFSFEYVDRGIFRSMLVNVTFFLGWAGTLWLIGIGLLMVFGPAEDEDAGSPPSELE